MKDGKKILDLLFGEAIETFRGFTWKKVILSLVAMVLLGTSVTLIYHTDLGMSAWDAVTVNIVENTWMEFRHVNPLVALVLMTLVHLILWKRPSMMFFFPLLVSFLIGAVIDLENGFWPYVAGLGLVWNLMYLILATLLVAFGLNTMIYIQFPLPAIDQFCHAAAKRLHLTFGQGKYIGEFLAMLAAIVLGLIYKTWDDHFNLGFTTFYYILVLGSVIDFVRNPFYRFLGIQTIQVYADDLTDEDIQQNRHVSASRAVIVKKNKILILHYKEEDFYLLPGGTREGKERLEHCLRREVLEETGLLVKVNEEHLIIQNHEPNITFTNHYFLTKLRSEKVYTQHINQTKSELAANIEVVWIDVNDVLTLFATHEPQTAKGVHLMEREFIALSSIL
ncbi:MAG: NUDIX domain-containing protein [Bacilli bacterium]|nr:NUDIX domain-containing protein [Bacilli bacterium]MBN2877500.1 NUDIX domain-containing protein [Bacilli bacterium]